MPVVDPCNADITHIYTSLKYGSDDWGDGTPENPYKTVEKGVEFMFKTDRGMDIEFSVMYVDEPGDYEGTRFTELPEKKVALLFKAYQRKIDEMKRHKRELFEKKLLESEKIKFTMDPSLPEAISIKCRHASSHVGERVKLSGWAHHIKASDDGKLMLVELRDGTGYLQCVFQGDLCRTRDALTLKMESTMTVYGIINKVPECQTSTGDLELEADYWEPISLVEQDFEKQIYGHPFDEQPNKYLLLRGEGTANLLRRMSVVRQVIREYYSSREYTEVSPPMYARTSVEKADETTVMINTDPPFCLAQSAQIYLEALIPALGDVYSMTTHIHPEKEKDYFKGKLPEYLKPKIPSIKYHQFIKVEAECPFINYDELLGRVEDMIVYVYERVRAKFGKAAEFRIPSRPFKRVRYEDILHAYNAKIEKKEQDRLKDARDYAKNEGFNEAKTAEFCKPQPVEVKAFGDDILDKVAWMRDYRTDKYTFITHLPANIAPFNSMKDTEDPRVTQSFALLSSGGAELVRGAMRSTDHEELIKSYKPESKQPELYKWYTEQSKFGACPHGGYSLDVETLYNCLIRGILKSDFYSLKIINDWFNQTK